MTTVKPHKKDYHYSGDESKKFWKRVNSLPEPDNMVVYSLGVALQNLEEQVLRALTNAEFHKRLARKKK
jgi:hypothetical protein